MILMIIMYKKIKKNQLKSYLNWIPKSFFCEKLFCCIKCSIVKIHHSWLFARNCISLQYALTASTIKFLLKLFVFFFSKFLIFCLNSLYKLFCISPACTFNCLVMKSANFALSVSFFCRSFSQLETPKIKLVN